MGVSGAAKGATFILTEEQFAKLLNQRTVGPEPPVAKAAKSRAPADAWMDRIVAFIVAYDYIDVTMLCQENRDKMKKKGSGRARRESYQLGGMHISTYRAGRGGFFRRPGPCKVLAGVGVLHWDSIFTRGDS